MINNYNNCFNDPNYPGNKNQQPKKYSENESDDKSEFIKKYYINFKCYSYGEMGHIYPNFPNKIKEYSVIITMSIHGKS